MLWISEREALLQYRLAPLPVRRLIAALGILHRRVLELIPQPIADLLPVAGGHSHHHSTRLVEHSHNKQLHDPASGRVTGAFRRFVFGFIAVYNRLPQAVVDLKSVKAFQACLQGAVCDMALTNADWQNLLSAGDRTSDVGVFQRRFRVNQSLLIKQDVYMWAV